MPPWSVLYLFYIKHDQKILKFDMSVGRGEARALFPVWCIPQFSIHQWVKGKTIEGIHIAVLKYNKCRVWRSRGLCTSVLSSEQGAVYSVFVAVGSLHRVNAQSVFKAHTNSKWSLNTTLRVAEKTNCPPRSHSGEVPSRVMVVSPCPRWCTILIHSPYFAYTVKTPTSPHTVPTKVGSCEYFCSKCMHTNA